MEFESKRLMFRFYTKSDMEFLYKMLSDPEMVRYIGDGKIRDFQGAEVFLEWIHSHYQLNSEYGLKLLVRKEDLVPVGHAGIVPQLVNGKTEYEVGYWIAKKYWGNGYASEAAKALLARGADELQMNRLISLIQPENSASRKVATKNGMQKEKEIVLNGRDVFVYAYIH